MFTKQQIEVLESNSNTYRHIKNCSLCKAEISERDLKSLELQDKAFTLLLVGDPYNSKRNKELKELEKKIKEFN